MPSFVRRLRPPRFSNRAAKSRGQGLVEFALALPVLILVLLITIDAGRLFYGYISLHNAARIAASYAATNADDWPEANPTVNPAKYDEAIARDTASLDCELAVNPPVFSPSGAPPRSIGDGHSATVTLTCVFRPLTPIIGSVIGNAVALTATETFPIRSGMLAGIPILPEIPSPSASVEPGPGECEVPTMMGVRVNNAITAWSDAGFGSNQLDVAIGNGNYWVGIEQVGPIISVWDGTFQNCSTFELLIGPVP